MLDKSIYITFLFEEGVIKVPKAHSFDFVDFFLNLSIIFLHVPHRYVFFFLVSQSAKARHASAHPLCLVAKLDLRIGLAH